MFDVVSKLYIGGDTGPSDMQSGAYEIALWWRGVWMVVAHGRSFAFSVELCSDMIDVVLDVSGIYGMGPSHEAVRAAAAAKARGKETEETQQDTLISQTEDLEEEIVDQDSAYDSESASVIRLSNGMVSGVCGGAVIQKSALSLTVALLNRFSTSKKLIPCWRWYV